MYENQRRFFSCEYSTVPLLFWIVMLSEDVANMMVSFEEIRVNITVDNYKHLEVAIYCISTSIKNYYI